jgi:hypothetical protein
MITKLLKDKPRDPVPYIFTYLQELSLKIKDPRPLNDNEINEMRNLAKKVDYLKELLDQDDAGSEADEDSQESDGEEMVIA